MFFDLSQSLKCRVHSLFWPAAVAHCIPQPQESFNLVVTVQKKRFSRRDLWVEEHKTKQSKRKKEKNPAADESRKLPHTFCAASGFPPCASVSFLQALVNFGLFQAPKVDGARKVTPPHFIGRR